jgi:flagellar basal-body rod modification protein FlgD
MTTVVNQNSATTASTATTPTTSNSATTTTSSGAYSSSQSTAALNQNYQTFLQLLTTQLQNQDPLNPEDSSQFTNQLVLFSQVEQQIDTNTSLNSILANQNTGLTQQALSYIGLNVAAQGSNFTYSGSGSEELGFNLASAAANSTVAIFDSSGNEVYAGTGGTADGENTFTWNGQDSSGNQQPAGTYSIQVTAADSSGNSVTATTVTPGQVTAVTSSGGVTYLTINGQQVPLSTVVSAAEPASGS